MPELPDHLYTLLRCPVTHSPLRPMSAADVAAVNQRIAQGSLWHLDGTTVQYPFDSGFVAEQSGLVYPVYEGVIVLLASMAIVREPQQQPAAPGQRLRQEKQAVASFYDETGWQKTAANIFHDTALFEDTRPVSREYISRCNQRVVRHLQPGTYLLDAASGSIQVDDYLAFSEQFTWRICVDLSFTGLQEARRRLGSRGIYLLADVTNLPLADGMVDAVVSLHTIYHVPANEQDTALHELYRVLKAGSAAVVVYSWEHHSPLMRLLMLPAKVVRMLRRGIGRLRMRTQNRHSPARGLYSHHYNQAWFARRLQPFEHEALVWRSVSVPFLKAYIHEHLLGRQLLALIYWLEECFPRQAGQLGNYPLFVLRKR